MDITIFISNNSKNRSFVKNVNAFIEVLNKRIIKQKDNKNMNTIFEKENWRKNCNRTSGQSINTTLMKPGVFDHV